MCLQIPIENDGWQVFLLNNISFIIWLNALIHYLVICCDVNPIRAEYNDINTSNYLLIVSQGFNSLYVGVTIKDQIQNVQFWILGWFSGDKNRAKTLYNSYFIFKFTPDPSRFTKMFYSVNFKHWLFKNTPNALVSFILPPASCLILKSMSGSVPEAIKLKPDRLFINIWFRLHWFLKYTIHFLF